MEGVIDIVGVIDIGGVAVIEIDGVGDGDGIGLPPQIIHVALLSPMSATSPSEVPNGGSS